MKTQENSILDDLFRVHLPIFKNFSGKYTSVTISVSRFRLLWKICERKQRTDSENN